MTHERTVTLHRPPSLTKPKKWCRVQTCQKLHYLSKKKTVRKDKHGMYQANFKIYYQIHLPLLTYNLPFSWRATKTDHESIWDFQPVWRIVWFVCVSYNQYIVQVASDGTLNLRVLYQLVAECLFKVGTKIYQL